jgi:dihydrofolate synthase/folylpolyglutamate synthase
VGRYTSPHLIDFRERITVDGVPITEEAVLSFLEKWIPVGEEMGATFFELTTALAFEWFATQKVDVAVIETGLGGRLDSTNVLIPRVATVTSIGLDHVDLLGNTLEAIAREKAGIFKRAVPAVIGEADPSIAEVLERCAKEAGAEPLTIIDDSYRLSGVEVSAGGTAFTLVHGADRERLITPLIGAYQARNTATAIATVSALGNGYLPSPKKITGALSRVFLPGRFQRSGKFIFDVGHNPDGARTVAQSLAALNPPGPRTAVVAVLADKDWRGILRALAPAVDRFILTDAPSAPAERRWDPREALVFAKSESFQAELEADIDSALSLAEKNSGTVVVTGSFHTVGDAMLRLQVSPFAA